MLQPEPTAHQTEDQARQEDADTEFIRIQKLEEQEVRSRKRLAMEEESRLARERISMTDNISHSNASMLSMNSGSQGARLTKALNKTASANKAHSLPASVPTSRSAAQL